MSFCEIDLQIDDPTDNIYFDDASIVLSSRQFALNYNDIIIEIPREHNKINQNYDYIKQTKCNGLAYIDEIHNILPSPFYQNYDMWAPYLLNIIKCSQKKPWPIMLHATPISTEPIDSKDYQRLFGIKSPNLYR